MRGRGNGRKNTNSRPQHIESNGPDVRVRGNAQQVVEKYLQLGRDATSSGDRITAESYFQHAEHYYRVMNTGNSNGASNGAGVSNGYEGRDSNGAHLDVEEEQQHEAPGSGPQPGVDQKSDEDSASSSRDSDDDQEPASA